MGSKTISTCDRKRINKATVDYITRKTNHDENVTISALKEFLIKNISLTHKDNVGRTYINERIFKLGYRSFTNTNILDWSSKKYYQKSAVLLFLEDELDKYPKYSEDINNLIDEFCIRTINIYQFSGSNIYSPNRTKSRYETVITLDDSLYIERVISKIKLLDCYAKVINCFSNGNTIYLWTKKEDSAEQIRSHLYKLTNDLWYAHDSNGEITASTKIPFNLVYPSEPKNNEKLARTRFLESLSYDISYT